MRIDKYLQVSRIIKRRAIAKEIIDKKRVLINDVIAKPGSKVNEEDRILIEFGDIDLLIEVKSIDEKTKKDQASEMYEVIKKEKRG